jgi:hypothetical protein
MKESFCLRINCIIKDGRNSTMLTALSSLPSDPNGTMLTALSSLPSDPNPTSLLLLPERDGLY